MRATSAQASWTMGLFPAVEPSLSLAHSPLAALVMVYLPGAAVEPVKAQRWLGLVPSPHPHCWSCIPEVAEPDGTSAQRVLARLTRV
jgi:hypothetical protein